MALSLKPFDFQAMFDYTEIPPAHWQDALIQTRENGVETIHVQVLWGAHEQVRGIRDFSKSSRLRLERFLGLAHSQGLSVELVLGFPPRKETFPSWTQSISDSATVPGCFLESGSEAFSYSAIPSLFNAEFMEGFEAFVQEVVSVTNLYQKPEGPISKIWFDIGAYHSDCQSLENPKFVQFLAKRYQTVSALNLIYQTSFRSFDSLNSKSSYRVLMDRRAWTANFDFQWCRDQMLAEWSRWLTQKFPELYPLSYGTETQTRLSAWELLLDSTFLEMVHLPQDKVFPCFPAGIANPTAIQAFRISECLSSRASRDKVRVHYSQTFFAKRVGAKVLAVISGKYLSRDVMCELEHFAASGGVLVFPFGTPLYDENLAAWKAVTDKNRYRGEKIQPDDNCWETISQLCRGLAQSFSQEEGKSHDNP